MVPSCPRCTSRRGSNEILDWCTICGEVLCARCVKRGCCGMTPAPSGQLEEVRRSESTSQGQPTRSSTVAPQEHALVERYSPAKDAVRCCSSARRQSCACAELWSCPEHGKHHFGIHD
ncbi:hypothetical protein D7W82_39490 [Corallococcus sp. CA049B]|nr:hypothetical protein D7W82_39490 [Corallococcus sp. CA049B]